MRLYLIAMLGGVGLLCASMVADVMDVQPAESYETVLGSSGWSPAQKSYTLNNTCLDHVYWQASAMNRQAVCQPWGGWIAPGASRNVSICPGSAVATAGEGTYTDEMTFDFEPRVWGDINGDRGVNVGDLQILVIGWGHRTGEVNYGPAWDLNGDGVINVGDLQILVRMWGQSYSAVSS